MIPSRCSSSRHRNKGEEHLKVGKQRIEPPDQRVIPKTKLDAGSTPIKSEPIQMGLTSD